MSKQLIKDLNEAVGEGLYEAALEAADLIEQQQQRIAELEKDAALWRDLVSHQRFNNKPQVGYAINRAIERVAALEQKEKS